MIDIRFYMKAHEIKRRLMSGEDFDKDYLFSFFEENRSKSEPVVYNIETTNACNMRCTMCPRTTKMTRKIETISKDTFNKIITQLRPWTSQEWSDWEEFVTQQYHIDKNDMSENHFYLYIIPKVIQLHGYGDPLLDKNMPDYVKILTQKNIPSYFSCNPANIDVDKTIQMMENGLDYIKYSIESVDDKKHKMIRGEASNFSASFKNIKDLLTIKKERGFQTIFVITMLDLDQKDQQEEYRKLKNAFKDLDVYIYLKSEDQQWYRQNIHGTNSIHWSEICMHPWNSMTVKSNGEIAMCMEDYDNEIILGNAEVESLIDIWNGEKYIEFRRDHFSVTKGIKCSERCDMKEVGELLR